MDKFVKVSELIDEVVILEREYKFLFIHGEYDLLPGVQKEINERRKEIKNLLED